MTKYPGPTTYYLMGTVPVDEKTMMPIRPGVNGGPLHEKDSTMPDLAKPTNYISVESVEEYSRKVEALGRQNCCAQDGDSRFGLVGAGVGS